MLSFKKWLHNENLAGPGGGPEFQPDSQEKLASDMVSHGVGAFPTFKKEAPDKKTATTDYLDPRFAKKFMAKTEKTSKICCKKLQK